MIKGRLRFAASTIFLLVIIPTICLGIPQLLSYQGRLNDPFGVPVNGNLAMTFTIYNDSLAGTALWTETQTVTISKGSFSVKLGSITALTGTVFTTDNLYLGVKAGADEEMKPRQRITSGGYAYVAEKALNVASNVVTTTNINVGGTQTAGQVLSSDGSTAKWVTAPYVPIGAIIAWNKTMNNMPALPDGWLECNGQQINDHDSPLYGQYTPNINSSGTQKFLRGSTSSGATGGSESFSWSHYHGHIQNGGYLDSYYRGASTDVQGFTMDLKPPYYEVVWIIRIK